MEWILFYKCILDRIYRISLFSGFLMKPEKHICLTAEKNSTFTFRGSAEGGLGLITFFRKVMN